MCYYGLTRLEETAARSHPATPPTFPRWCLWTPRWRTISRHACSGRRTRTRYSGTWCGKTPICCRKYPSASEAAPVGESIPICCRKYPSASEGAPVGESIPIICCGKYPSASEGAPVGESDAAVVSVSERETGRQGSASKLLRSCVKVASKLRQSCFEVREVLPGVVRLLMWYIVHGTWCLYVAILLTSLGRLQGARGSFVRVNHFFMCKSTPPHPTPPHPTPPHGTNVTASWFIKETNAITRTNNKRKRRMWTYKFIKRRRNHGPFFFF